jgi:uncharacterized repeat protein (TIGR01451 family)
VTFGVTELTPLPAGVTTLTNTAVIGDDGANGVDPTPNDNTSTDTTPVTAKPDMVIDKSDNGLTSLRANQLITYTLTFSNVGNQAATGIIITESVPANTVFVGPRGWHLVSGTGAAGSVYTSAAGGLRPALLSRSSS